MKDYNFYTPSELVSLMLQSLPSNERIMQIIDICCGTWNMLKAAQAKFPQASVLGVDIDINAKKHIINNAGFVHQDGRLFADACVMSDRKFDLVLSNPPFGPLLGNQKHYTSSDNIIVRTKRYEAEMLWANYQLVNDGGWLLTILPSTYLNGKTYIKHRVWLAENYEVYSIFKLPLDTFCSNLSTVGILLQKRKENGFSRRTTDIYIVRQGENSNWNCELEAHVSPSSILAGRWDETAFVASEPESDAQITIFRGNISSNHFSSSGCRVLHCSSVVVNGKWKCGERKCDLSSFPNFETIKYAEKGDIIINRIGKYAGFWSIWLGEKCVVSDCIIVIKSPSDKMIKTLNKCSDRGRITVPLHGVATKFVTIDDVRRILSK